MSTFLDDGLRDGDPYNLRSGTPPFLLEAEPPVNVGKMGENFPSTGRTTFCGIATA